MRDENLDYYRLAQFARTGLPLQGKGRVVGMVRGRCPRLRLVQPFGLRGVAELAPQKAGFSDWGNTLRLGSTLRLGKHARKEVLIYFFTLQGESGVTFTRSRDGPLTTL